MKEKIAELKKLLEQADKVAAELVAHEAAGKFPQPFAIRSAIANGALAHIEALDKLAAEPKPAETKAAAKK